jgi:viroplasmin and RNaseH domain-containing protein
MNNINCPICSRVTSKEYQEKHHLDPKDRKGNSILVCCSCGDILHKLFTIKELGKKYNTLDKILANEDVKKWAEWVKKKPNDFRITMATKKRK